MINILFNPKKAERHPVEMFLIGVFYSSISILLSFWIFPDFTSLVMVFFTVLSCLYVVQGAIKQEENKDYDFKSEKWVLREHSRALVFLLFLFLGFVFSFTFWAFILSPEKISVLFNLQSAVVEGIRAVSSTGNSVNFGAFLIIFFNNFKVLLISLVFAFFFGAGAIFVLAWNASVMGFVIGDLARNSSGILSLPQAFLKYFLHGIPEMTAYLIISLAGGIIYIAIWKQDFLVEGRRKRIMIDVLVLFFISVLFLFVSALIEVFVSPLI